MRILPATILISTFFAAACAGISEPPAQSDEVAVASMVAGTMQALTQPASPLPVVGARAEFANVSFVIPADVADAALAGAIPAATDPENTAPWDIAPEYTKFVLAGYRVPGAFHEPQIRIYPAREYAALDTGGQESIRRLQAIVSGGEPDPEHLPFIPFFNAASVFAAQIQPISFQNGSGVRSLTEYAQYVATVNSRDLFYHFEGLTQDSAYYIIAILPVSVPLLAADEKPDAYIPSGGIPFPGYEDQAAVEAYYAAVTELLNGAPPEDFSPPLAALDEMIHSLLVASN